MSDSALTAAADGGKARAAKPGDKRENVIARVLTYIRQVVSELRKVIWPTRNELVTYTTVVLVFVVVMVSIVSAFDFVFTQGVLAVFGK